MIQEEKNLRIKSLEIGKFKNLEDFNIEFQSDSLIDLIIGKNGCGKSNFFEAIVEIFRWLNEPETIIPFEFKLGYEINGDEITVENTGGILHVNGKSVKRINKIYLPENIIIYYSGHNDTVSQFINDYEEKFKKQIKGDELKDLRLFFGLNTHHRLILLLTILLLDESSIIRKHLCSQINIDKIYSDIKFIFKKPFFSKSTLESWDDMPFWGVKGYLKSVLMEMEKNRSKSNETREEGYIANREEYVIYSTLDGLRDHFSDFPPINTFRYFDDLRVIDMIKEISFDVKLINGQIININHFSDGEYQTFFINGILDLFKERNCLVLLDEPDSFLHPEWQHKLIKNILEYIPEINNNNHILLTSHCASTIVSSEDDVVNMFEIKDKQVKSLSVSRNYAIQKLSSGLITLNEESQILSIINKIKIDDKPILFTEGPTDIPIIELAWRKLRTGPLPFSIINAFCCSYLRRLIQDESIYAEAGGNTLFALFDFDEAYNEWNSISLKGELLESDPYKGLCCKVKNQNGYAFLLPVPQEGRIKSQVIKNSTSFESYKHESRLCIELLFYGYEEVEDFFQEVDERGGGKIIQFKGDKKHFANDIINKLEAEAFNIFEPLFSSIEEKI